MIIISNYSLEYHKQSNVYYVRSKEEAICPLCGERLQIIGSRRRGVCVQDGSVLTLVIRRLKCKACGHVHHELPDMVVPYKRYEAEVVTKIVAPGAGNIEDYPCEQSTAKRLQSWFLKLMNDLIRLVYKDIESYETYGLFVCSFLKIYRKQKRWLCVLIRWLADAGYWIQTRLA